MSDPKYQPSVHLLWVGLLVEGGLFVVALLIGAMGFFAHSQPLYSLDWLSVKEATIFGCLVTIPMLAYLVISHYWKPAFLKPMDDFLEQSLKPMFASATIFELLLLSIMAGIGEELFFRWCIQGGVSSAVEPFMEGTTSVWLGVAVASILFGLCHWINTAYGVTTILIGAYLGWAMVHFDNWLVPAFAHALFDFIALNYIVKRPAKLIDVERP